LFAGVLSAPEKEGQPAGFALQGVTIQRIAPDGMSAAMRWLYLDDKSFDPASFEKDLAADVLGAAVNLPQ